MRKIIFLVFICISAFSALYPAYLLEEDNKCIEDFYYKNKRLYYKNFGEDYYRRTWQSYTILGGMEYNTSNGHCSYTNKAKKLGLTGLQYNFFVALFSILVGFVWLFFITYSFVESLRRR